VKKGLEYASKLGIPYVIILGEDELKSQRVKIKDMARGIEIDAGIGEIASTI
jgi:histidyl-tRNA synthetase